MSAIEKGPIDFNDTIGVGCDPDEVPQIFAGRVAEFKRFKGVEFSSMEEVVDFRRSIGADELSTHDFLVLITCKASYCVGNRQ